MGQAPVAQDHAVGSNEVSLRGAAGSRLRCWRLGVAVAVSRLFFVAALVFADQAAKQNAYLKQHPHRHGQVASAKRCPAVNRIMPTTKVDDHVRTDGIDDDADPDQQSHFGKEDINIDVDTELDVCRGKSVMLMLL